MCLTKKTNTLWNGNRVLILAVALLAIGQALLEATPRPQQPKPPAVQPTQPRPAQPVQPRPAQPAPAGQRREKIPPPEEISGSQLQTRDGVQLSATFFPGMKEKESVPVLLLHNWKSSRKEFAALAPELQKIGCAVLVPDLRGHGASTKQMVYLKGGLQEKELDAAKFKTPDLAKIATNDMAALRSFLVKKNNAGELNLNKLVVVGSEMGAAIAMRWAAYDWSIPNYEHAGIKQSQDVKALVLISPKWSYTGLDTADILNARGFSAVRDRISVMLLVGGEDARRLKDVETIESKLVTNRSQPEALAERKVLLVPPFPTKMQAEQLLNFRDFPIPKMICHFIETQVIKDEPDAVWMEHK